MRLARRLLRAVAAMTVMVVLASHTLSTEMALTRRGAPSGGL
jgi:hypothetical protein